MTAQGLMVQGLALADPSEARGYLLVLAIVLPVAGVLASFVLGGRNAERIALMLMPVGLAIALAIFAAVSHAGEPITFVLGATAPPLGISLRADGLSAAMLVITSLVVGAVGLYARADFATPSAVAEARAPYAFWTLLLAVWAGLNAVFLGNDLFNLYVALELLTFGAVPLVSLDGRAETLTAALRYLVFALAGSIFYLLGTALIYGAYGTLDIVQLSALVRPDRATAVALALMIAGLLAKTALFPLHLWLPPAHAGAPAAASAILSALVVKGSFFLVMRLAFFAMPGVLGITAGQLLATLGAGAIICGSVVALRQARLKMLVAYSTVAQIGYLFLMLPLLLDPLASEASRGAAWTGGWMQLFSHALAKAAMFLAAGLIAESAGHDRIGELGGIARTVPVTVIAFGLAGLSLMGVPPSGGFVAKWLMLRAAAMEGQWWWVLVILAGGLLAGAYVIRVLIAAVSGSANDTADFAVAKKRMPVSQSHEAIVLALAIGALLLGLVPLEPSALLQIGLPPVGPEALQP